MTTVCRFLCSFSWSRCIHGTHRRWGALQTRAANRPIKESWLLTSWLRPRTRSTSRTFTASSQYAKPHTHTHREKPCHCRMSDAVFASCSGRSRCFCRTWQLRPAPQAPPSFVLSQSSWRRTGGRFSSTTLNTSLAIWSAPAPRKSWRGPSTTCRSYIHHQRCQMWQMLFKSDFYTLIYFILLKTVFFCQFC